ncbi:hypothetical protein Hanom_Chr04g00373111 [Helianthus anomalus]
MGFASAYIKRELKFLCFHCLTTTAPEQLTFALQWSMKPLAYVGVPVAKVILTLILLLRACLGFCDLLTYWLFPLTYTIFAKHHFKAYDFSKSQ